MGGWLQGCIKKGRGGGQGGGQQGEGGGGGGGGGEKRGGGGGGGGGGQQGRKDQGAEREQASKLVNHAMSALMTTTSVD